MTTVFVGGSEMINMYLNSPGPGYVLFQSWHTSRPFRTCYWLPTHMIQPIYVADYLDGYCGVCVDFKEESR